MQASQTASREFENQPDPGLSTLCKTEERELPYCKPKLQTNQNLQKKTKPINGKTRHSVFSNHTPNALHITKHDKLSHVSPDTFDLRPRVEPLKPNQTLTYYIPTTNQTKRIVELNRTTFTQQSACGHIVPRCN